MINSLKIDSPKPYLEPGEAVSLYLVVAGVEYEEDAAIVVYTWLPEVVCDPAE